MSAMPRRVRVHAVALVAFLALANGFTTLGRNGAAAQDEKFLVGANRCQSCHSHPDDYKKEADRLLCRMLEYPIWNGDDKHKIAAKVLLAPLRSGDGQATGPRGRGEHLVHELPRHDRRRDGRSTVRSAGQRRQLRGVPWPLPQVDLLAQFPDDPKWRNSHARRRKSSSGFFDLANPPVLELAEALAERAPMPAKVFFGSGGSDGIDTAAKLARRYWWEVGERDRTVLISRTAAYHGTHGFGTALGGIPSNQVGFGPLNETIQVRHDSLEEMEQAFARIGPERVAAVFMEPVIGAGGVYPPAPGYIEGVAELCRRTGRCS